MTAPAPAAKARNEAARERAAANPEAVADAAVRWKALPELLGAGDGIEDRDGGIYLKLRVDLNEPQAELAAIVRDLASNLWLRSGLTGRPGVAGFDSAANATAICAGLAQIAIGDGLAALTAVVEAMPCAVEPFRPVHRASLPRLHRVTEAEAARLPGFADAPAPGEQFDLPGFGPVVHGCPSWLLWMFDAAGGESMAQGRGAPWPMRLFVGALLHVAVHDRTGRWITVRIPNDDEPASPDRPAGVHRWLHPRGWWPANKRRDWHRFPAALDAMRAQLSYVPVPGIGSVAMLFPSVIPRSPRDPFVEFTVRIPASAAHGALIDWPRLCQYGTDSAALHRAYLSASALMDKSAHRGRAITREIHPPLVGATGKPRRAKGGRILRDTSRTEPNPAARYVEAVTDKDLARMIGFDPENRFRRRDARKAFERLHADGVIDLVQDRGLWWLYGPRGGA